jgi:hypothetical protein
MSRSRYGTARHKHDYSLIRRSSPDQVDFIDVGRCVGVYLTISFLVSLSAGPYKSYHEWVLLSSGYMQAAIPIILLMFFWHPTRPSTRQP